MRVLISLSILLLLTGCATGSLLENAVDTAFNRNVLITTDIGGICSGFTIETGVVLTAKHCVEGTLNVEVNGIKVDTITPSKDKDVARLDVQTKKFKRIGFVKEISLGDKIRMVANPTGKVGWSFHGEVSYIDEKGTIHTSFIGIPGTSGGGVITEQSKFCGIHTGYHYFTMSDGQEFRTSGTFIPFDQFLELIKEKKYDVIIDLPILQE